MLTGTNLVYTKQHNLRTVHEVIRLFGPLSRAEIARRTELTVQTVSNLTKELLEFGLVSEQAPRQAGRGAPSVPLVLNPSGAFAVGLDLDRDHLTGVLVDLAGTVRQRIHVEIGFPTPDEALDRMVATTDSLIAREGLKRESVWGVGAGIPGPMYRVGDGEGYVVNPTAFPGWHNVPLARSLQERLQMPVFLENNATAAAIGERWYGAAQQIRTFFYVYFGSGLGGGLVLQGQPYEGFTGNAGELGYLPSVLSGEPAAGEDRPHVGLHFNLPRLYQALRDQGTEARTPDDLARLLSQGHPGLLQWLEVAADHLAGLVLAVEYIVDPEAVFFGGRLPDSILTELMAGIEHRLPGRRVGGGPSGPRHVLATAGVDAAALGVATLPIYDFFAPSPERLLKPSNGARRPSALSAARATT